jgi:hypothetical protein
VAVEQAAIGIPVCSICGQMVSTVRLDPDGRLLGFVEPAPPHCAAAERHPLGAGTVGVGDRRAGPGKG